MPHVWLFLLTSIAITVMPGPDNLQVIARGASQGRKAGLTAAAGFASGCLFHTTLAALGLAAVLQSSPVAFQAIRWLGAAYLIWLGVQATINMGVNMGLLPTKGLTLPLMSYGGSGIVANCLALGVLLRIDWECRQLMRGQKV